MKHPSVLSLLFLTVLIKICVGFIPHHKKALIPGHQKFSASSKPLQAVHKDIIIIGGSLAGLSIALELAESDEACQVTILDGEIPATGRSQTEFGKTNVASMAAAGMLAPMSERLPSGPLLDICLQSRAMYAEWVTRVEKIAQSGSLGEKYLWQDDSDMEPWEIGYQCNGGFLAPAFAGDSIATWAPPKEGGEALWLDQTQILEMEPNMNPEVIGGWWFPSDASVDARRLTCSLRAACANSGVEFCYGKDFKVTGVDQSNPDKVRVLTESGITYEPNKVIVANGAWMKEIVPVPIVPHKGQSLSVTLMEGEGIDRVLFAQDTYIVPKADGRIIVGATIEPNTFDTDITPAGMTHIINNACELLPSIARGKIGEVWCGLRPTTPDKAPILGTSKHPQVLIAGGYWRNGVLLAPKTAQIISSLILSTKELSASDQELLDAFNWDRFYDKDKAQGLAADIRYKSQMHSIQYRGKGSATAGEELGFYEGASSAKNERKADRAHLWSTSDDDSVFEKAAQKGREDATAFIVGDKKEKPQLSKYELGPGRLFPDLNAEEQDPVEMFADMDEQDKTNALTVGASSLLMESSDTDEKNEIKNEAVDDLHDIYATIKANKARADVTPPDQNDSEEEIEEFDFEIYRVDENGNERYIPPRTSIGDFEEMIAAEASNDDTKDVSDQPNEQTYDGYVDIQSQNSRSTRDGELDAMRAARRSNRGMESELFGSSHSEVSHNEANPEKLSETSDTQSNNLEEMYASIRENKASADISISDFEDEVKPEYDFQIYWVDPDTNEEKLIPPNTSPGEFHEMISEEKVITSETNSDENESKEGSETPNESTYDGYIEIQSKNSRSSRDEELDIMRNARIKNRQMESETFGSNG